MNKYVITGIVAIAIGTIVMAGSSEKLLWLIVGGVINGLGLFVMAAGSLISSRKDKSEIIARIHSFREEIAVAKKESPTVESLTAVENIENEFGEWAGTLLTNMESKVVERQKDDIILRENEINLSKKWRHIYECVCNTLHQMLTAYNEQAENKLEFTIPEIPFNLFGEEAKSFKSIIAFNNDNAWAITLQIIRPYKKEEIPNIVVNFVTSFSGESAKEMAKKGVYGTFLHLLLNPENEYIKPRTSELNMHIGSIKDYYSIKPSDYKSSIRELFTTIIEYQLISLVHQKS